MRIAEVAVHVALALALAPGFAAAQAGSAPLDALAAGDFARARERLDSARVRGLDARGWLAEAVVRLYAGRPDAAEAYRRALAADPSLGSTPRGRAAERALEERAFQARAPSDSVALAFTACWSGSPYRCIDLSVDGRTYRVLLDTGNGAGWTVHDSMLARAISGFAGEEARAWTGSAGAVRSRRLRPASVDFGGFTLHGVAGLFFPKPSEAYFDANLNPFRIRERVITLDYARGLLVVRSKARFDRWRRSRPAGTLVVLPVVGHAWPYVAASVNGAPAMALIETGAEGLALSRRFAEREGVALTPITEWFRGREYHLFRAGVAARVGEIALPGDSAAVADERMVDPLTGFGWDLMLGPGVLEHAFALTLDPYDHVVVLEHVPAGPARG